MVWQYIPPSEYGTREWHRHYGASEYKLYEEYKCSNCGCSITIHKSQSAWFWQAETQCPNCNEKGEPQKARVDMSREKAILILQELWRYEQVKYKDCEVRTALDMAIKTLKQEPKTGKWIPVSERLPEPYEQVLRTVKSFGWNCVNKTHINIGSICPTDTDVIAWMPLPKPYKVESED